MVTATRYADHARFSFDDTTREELTWWQDWAVTYVANDKTQLHLDGVAAGIERIRAGVESTPDPEPGDEPDEDGGEGEGDESDEDGEPNDDDTDEGDGWGVPSKDEPEGDEPEGKRPPTAEGSDLKDEDEDDDDTEAGDVPDTSEGSDLKDDDGSDNEDEGDPNGDESEPGEGKADKPDEDARPGTNSSGELGEETEASDQPALENEWVEGKPNDDRVDEDLDPTAETLGDIDKLLDDAKDDPAQAELDTDIERAVAEERKIERLKIGAWGSMVVRIKQ